MTRCLGPAYKLAALVVCLACTFFHCPYLLTQVQSATKTSTLLVDTDDNCRLFLDDEDKGVITPVLSQKFTISLGQHILKCTIESVPDLVWRKVIEVKDTSQVAAAISLKALHIQYDLAVSKSKSQKTEAESVAQKQMREAEAEEKLREAAKLQVPQTFLEMVKGDWQGVHKNPNGTSGGLLGHHLNPDTTFTFNFDNVENGAVAAFMVMNNRTKWKVVFSPVPPNRLDSIGSSLCISTKDKNLMKAGATKNEQGWAECQKQRAGPSNYTIYVIDKTTLELHMADMVVSLNPINPKS